VKPGRAVTVVGIGDDGCKGLSARALEAVMTAQWLVGGERQLAFLPQFRGERLSLKGGLTAALDRVVALADENNVCVLASGDPLFFGVGGLLVDRLGAEHVEVLPQPSALQWAFARVGLRWDDADFLSLHGRAREGFLTRLRSSGKLALFTDPTNHPAALAAVLLEHGLTGFVAWVCENLGGPDERVRRFAIAELAACADVGPLNVLILVRDDPAWRPPPAIPFLHEDDFAKRIPKKGLITKREVRLLSLAALQLRPDSVVWDIGAGSGSVAIEAALLAPRGRVYAVEVDPEGVEICRDNLRTHAVDNVRVVAGRAPEALADLPAPDAVFVGGSQGSLDAIIDAALQRLRPGGRLVVNAITLDNSAEAYQAFQRRNLTPEVTLLQVSRSQPLGKGGDGGHRYLRFEALNPIQIFAVGKEGGS
jgi:precorrin-6B C5,15-methyltransferase / cobalt-precorrin-6B C5,C15-methyltransferase